MLHFSISALAGVSKSMPACSGLSSSAWLTEGLLAAVADVVSSARPGKGRATSGSSGENHVRSCKFLSLLSLPMGDEQSGLRNLLSEENGWMRR